MKDIQLDRPRTKQFSLLEKFFLFIINEKSQTSREHS